MANTPSKSGSSAENEGQDPSSWPIYIVAVMILLILIFLPVYNKTERAGGSRPDKHVFPLPVESKTKVDYFRGVVGAWSEGRGPKDREDSVSLDPGQRLVVRVFDLDGWILQQLAAGRVRVGPENSSDQTQTLAQNWARSIREAARQGITPEDKQNKEAVEAAAKSKPLQDAIQSEAAQRKSADDAAKSLDQAKQQGSPNLSELENKVKTANEKLDQAQKKTTEERGAVTQTIADQWRLGQNSFMDLFRHTLENLTLNIDGNILLKTEPVNATESRVFEDRAKNEDRYDDFIFRPDMADPDLRNIFLKLARGAGFNQTVTLTLGFPDKAEKRVILPSLLGPSAQNASQRPVVSFVPMWKVWWIVVYLGATVAVMAFLACKTSLIRALDSRRRPDGRYQLSLTHTQLALWFIVVLSSYFYLWVVTGEMEKTFSDTGLYLVGISIVAAFGSHAIQGIIAPDRDIALYNQALSTRVGKDKETILQAIRSSLETVMPEWEAAHAAAAGADPKSELAMKATRLYETCEDLRRQERYMLAGLPYRWLTDLLSENGEITIHRFQMLAWTFGLAFIFFARVFTDLTMPTFPTQILALMGISAGTYLGFRIPETQKIKETLADPAKLASPPNPPAPDRK